MEEIIIRSVESQDIEGLRDLYKGESAYSGTLRLPFTSLADLEKLKNPLPPGVYVLVAELNGEIVGHSALIQEQNPRRRHVAGFMIAIKDAYQRQGIGSKMMAAVLDLADNWLNLRRVDLTVFTDNESAIHLYKKHGFHIEGELKDFAFRNGEYVSAYQMGRIKESA